MREMVNTCDEARPGLSSCPSQGRVGCERDQLAVLLVTDGATTIVMSSENAAADILNLANKTENPERCWAIVIFLSEYEL